MLKSEGGGGTCRAFTVSMARYGYASISSTDQDCSLQEARLRAEGCKVIRTEKASGKSRDGRDELARIMDFLHAGDELVVVKLDRLGRSTRDVLNLVHDLEAKGAALTVLEPAFSAKDAAGPILVTVLEMAAEVERKFIREQQHAGIEATKARGAYKGTRDANPLCRWRRCARCEITGMVRAPSPKLSASRG